MGHQICNCSRRTFLRRGGLTLAGLGATSLIPTPLIREALAQAGPDTTGKRLLYIFLRGGNDGINTLVPYGDPDYNSTNRPTLHIPTVELLDLNGFAGLHPALENLMPAFNAGELAAMHRIGYPNMTRSHFDGQRIWENGDPTQPFLYEGWIWRFMRDQALAEGVDLPAFTSPNGGILMRGQPPYHVNVLNPDNFDYTAPSPKKDKFKTAWGEIFGDLPLGRRYRDVFEATEIRLLDTIDEYATWDQANWHPTDPVSGDYLFPVDDAHNPVDPSGPNGLKFSSAYYPFFKSLKVTALSLLESDGGNNGTRIAGVELGGFDTHESQGQLAGAQRDRLNVIGYGIDSLRTVLSGAATNEPRGYASIWNDTIVLTMSEFGRTTLENGSLGTDHGNACAIFAAGGNINGGVYNCDPGTWPAGIMFGDEGRDLLELTDYRAVFWEILREHMGADPGNVDSIFPGYSSAGLTELGLLGA